jgi:hypothetical protein
MATETEFEIELVLALPGVKRVQVLARKLEVGDFAIPLGATLGGVRVSPVLSAPRAKNAQGELRLDLFTFLLLDPQDAGRLSPGQRVLLTSL